MEEDLIFKGDDRAASENIYPSLAIATADSDDARCLGLAAPQGLTAVVGD